MKKEENYSVILITLFGTVGSILLGLIFYRMAIFSPASAAFQFISSGIIGALFFGLLEFKPVKVQNVGIIILLILSLIFSAGKSLNVFDSIRNIFYLVSLLASIKIYHLLIKRNPRIPLYLRCFILVVLYTVLNLTIGILLYIIIMRIGLPSLHLMYSLVVFSVLVGLGIGLGIDLFLNNKKRILGWLIKN